MFPCTSEGRTKMKMNSGKRKKNKNHHTSLPNLFVATALPWNYMRHTSSNIYLAWLKASVLQVLFDTHALSIFCRSFNSTSDITKHRLNTLGKWQQQRASFMTFPCLKWNESLGPNHVGTKLTAKSLPFPIESSPRLVLELLVSQNLRSLLHNTLHKSQKWNQISNWVEKKAFSPRYKNIWHQNTLINILLKMFFTCLQFGVQWETSHAQMSVCLSHLNDSLTYWEVVSLLFLSSHHKN